MKSAREIACMPVICRGYAEGHSVSCDRATEAIQQAREDGARWALEQAEVAAALGWTVNPVSVRLSAP